MKSLFASVFAAVIGLLVLLCTPAAYAGTWTQVSDYTPNSGPIAAGPAGNNIQNSGWLDKSGNSWSINSSNQLATPYTANYAWSYPLMRPASESMVDGQMRTKFAWHSPNDTVWFGFRGSYNNGLTQTGYMVGINATQITAGSLINGAYTNFGSSAAFTTLNDDWVYCAFGSVVQTTSTTTTLSVSLYWGDCTTLVQTFTVTDTNPALQNLSGTPYSFIYTANSSDNLPTITELTTYTDAAVNQIPVSSPAFLFSPADWKGDTGRAGSVYRQSWNNGAWAKVTWNAGPSPTAILQLPPTATSNMVSYFLNGTLVDNVPATGDIFLNGVVPNSVNTLWLHLRNSTQSSRWGQASGAGNTVQIQGLAVDAGSSAGITQSAPKGWVLIIGDSITEGVQANAGADDELFDYSFLLGQALEDYGYDYGISACGYSGWLHPGDSTQDVPAYYTVSGSSNGAGGSYNDAASRWNKVDSGLSLLDSHGQISAYGALGTPPAAIVINYGTNDTLFTSNTSDMQASIVQAITALRAAAPNAQIILLMPFGIRNPTAYGNGASYAAVINAAVAAYQLANPSDTNVQLIDLNLQSVIEQAPYVPTANAVHPEVQGHALVAPQVTEGVISLLDQITPAQWQALSFRWKTLN